MLRGNTQADMFAENLSILSRTAVTVLGRATTGLELQAQAALHALPYSIEGADYARALAAALEPQVQHTIPAAIDDARLTEAEIAVVHLAVALVHPDTPDGIVDPSLTLLGTYHDTARQAETYLSRVPDALNALEEKEGHEVAEAVVDLFLESAQVAISPDLPPTDKRAMLMQLITGDGEIVTSVRLSDANNTIIDRVTKADKVAGEIARKLKVERLEIQYRFNEAYLHSFQQTTLLTSLGDQGRKVVARQASIGGDPVHERDLQTDGAIMADVDVSSRTYNFGNASILAVHRITPERLVFSRLESNQGDKITSMSQETTLLRDKLLEAADFVAELAASDNPDPRAIATLLELAQQYAITPEDVQTVGQTETLLALAQAMRVAGNDIALTDQRSENVLRIANDWAGGNRYPTPLTASSLIDVVTDPTRNDDTLRWGRLVLGAHARRTARSTEPTFRNDVQILVSAGTDLPRAIRILAQDANARQINEIFATQGPATAIMISGGGTEKKPLPLELNIKYPNGEEVTVQLDSPQIS